jgi:hypothetical protein
LARGMSGQKVKMPNRNFRSSSQPLQIPESGSNSIRLRPLCLAAYRAVSAWVTRAFKSGGLVPRNPATPKLAVAVMVLFPKVKNAPQDRLFVCAQNVDNLHEQARSRNVMHRELFKSRCDTLQPSEELV